MSWDPVADIEVTTGLIHGIYLKQKDSEAQAGRDTGRDSARMDQWIQDVKDGNGGADELDRRFPEVRESHPACPKCRGDGMFFSLEARKRARGRIGVEIVTTPGMVFCKCPAGQNKYRSVRSL